MISFQNVLATRSSLIIFLSVTNALTLSFPENVVKDIPVLWRILIVFLEGQISAKLKKKHSSKQNARLVAAIPLLSEVILHYHDALLFFCIGLKFHSIRKDLPPRDAINILLVSSLIFFYMLTCMFSSSSTLWLIERITLDCLGLTLDCFRAIAD